MGLRRWIRRILRRKDAARAHAPAFERLEPRILLNGGPGLSTGQILSTNPSWMQAVMYLFQPRNEPRLVANDDMYSTSEDQPRVVHSPGILANDIVTGDVEIILVEGPSYGQISIGKDGSFVYTPQANWSGQDHFTYMLANTGGLSNTATVWLPVAPVNDPPTFVSGSEIVVPQDSGPVVVEGWARSIFSGPKDESNQDLTWIISTNRPDLFKALPAISLQGTLSFEPAAGAIGQATVTVQLKDDGGTENGGIDRSELVSFTITIKGNNQVLPPSQPRQLFLPTIRQGDMNSDGILVSELLAAGLGQDEAVKASRGLAVVFADLHMGVWQYSINGGKTWEQIVRTEEGAPTFLLADRRTRIRFVPNPDFRGTISRGLICLPWDGTGADNGSIRFIEVVGREHPGVVRLQVGIVVNPVIQLQPSRKGNSILVYQQSGRIKATSSKQTILDLPLGCFEQLIIIGAKNTSDTVTIDTGLGGPFSIQDGILLEANDSSDLLVIRGIAGGDLFELFRDLVLLDGLAFRTTGLRQVRLEGMAGDDTYRIHTIGIPTIIADTAGRDTLDFFYALSSLRIDIGKANGQWQQVLSSSERLALKGTFEDVIGTAWSDIIYGNSIDNRIWGWCGGDIIYGGGGNDWLFGQSGSDQLFGQSGSDLLFGGDGDDILDGGDGNDILIGGKGDDNLLGSTGQDILIGGITIYDDDQQAIRSIMAIWTGAQSFNTRVSRLTDKTSRYHLVFGLTVWKAGLDSLKADNGTDLCIC